MSTSRNFKVNTYLSLSKNYSILTSNCKDVDDLFLEILDLFDSLEISLKTLSSANPNSNEIVFCVMCIIYCILRADYENDAFGLEILSTAPTTTALVLHCINSFIFPACETIKLFTSILIDRNGKKYEDLLPGQVCTSLASESMRVPEKFLIVSESVLSSSTIENTLKYGKLNPISAFEAEEQKKIEELCNYAIDFGISESEQEIKRISCKINDFFSDLLQSDRSDTSFEAVLEMLEGVKYTSYLDLLFSESVWDLLERCPNIIHEICLNHMSVDSYNRYLLIIYYTAPQGIVSNYTQKWGYISIPKWI
ncbi:hypothetical protein BB560_004062 [Smittium megazygosporum]|uniref:Uncharacterized protein n=2 Tax=Smittium megazygosporum TaxID=133381 RepID=A0A2T9ZAA1_9FUNG|nr:hypothetical protein BB560_004062 [Smittium megazygosporum]